MDHLVTSAKIFLRHITGKTHFPRQKPRQLPTAKVNFAGLGMQIPVTFHQELTLTLQI